MDDTPDYIELVEKVKRLEAIAIAHEKSEEKLRLHSEIMMNMAEGVYLIRLSDGRIVYANPKFEKMFGYDRGEMLGKHVSIVNAPITKPPEETAEEIMEVLHETGEWYGEVHNIKKDGTPFWCHANVSTLNHAEYGEVLVSIHSDITVRKEAEIKNATLQRRLASLWKISSMVRDDFKTICDMALEEMVGMTESQFGFYGFLDSNESTLTLHSWSQNVLKACSVHENPFEYPIKNSGIWGNAVRERKPFVLNDYQLNCMHKNGLPDGHIPLTRILSVPIFSRDDKIVALGCVANKGQAYDSDDIHQLIAFLNSAQLILENRKTEEERKQRFKQALSELRILQGMLPLCSYCKKIRDDKGYWENVDEYIDKYSEADITHSICPECMEKHSP